VTQELNLNNLDPNSTHFGCH